MARLHRPHVPLEIRCMVAMRQLGYDGTTIKIVLLKHDRAMARLLRVMLGRLSGEMGCAAAELRLDHDPALGARARRGEGRKTKYTPDANDPDHLRYRPHGPEHEGSHLIKTNVRGDRGQFPDRVLIKRNRRAEKRAAEGAAKGGKNTRETGRKPRWPKRPFPKSRGFR